MTNKSKVEEEIQVEVLGSYNNSGELDLDNLNNNLKNNLSGVKYNSVEISDENEIKILPAVVKYNDYTVVIAENEVKVVEESVKPGEEVKKTEKYNYNDGVNVATIPEGFTVSTEDNKIDTGLVVIAPDGSEFVWVPVSKAVTKNEADGNENKAMAIRLSDGNYRGLLYDFEGTESKVKSGCTTTNFSNNLGYREPAVLKYNNGTVNVNDSEHGIELENLQSEYKEMIESVAEYGGFYVGRYETSYDGSNSNNVASKIGQIPMSVAYDNWYGMYDKQKNYASNVTFNNGNLSTIVGSSMIWGSQYDAMLNWMLKGSDKDKVTKDSTTHEKKNTGSTPEDVMNKIYDLGNNLSEWTIEVKDSGIRVYRGGHFNYALSPSGRDIAYPTYYGGAIGSRLTLYIK